ncbi:MAG: ABC transporter substrate-binding protein [Candidatus Eremiobacteraeota bacterium]|nr:ABC transporter substrate-binding protein [Candidatus Eremiobacteraeota bacterium]
MTLSNPRAAFGRRTFTAGALSALAAALVARRAHGAEGRALSIGYVPSTLFAPVFLAIERGYLGEAGFRPVATPVVAGQDALALLATGHLDMVAAGVSAAFFNGVSRGLDIRIVASTGYQPKKGHPSALMVRKDLYDAGLRSPRDLRGKTIAFIGGAGATAGYYVARILRRDGLRFSDVRTVNISTTDQGVAFERKAIDAAFTSAPSTQAFEERGLATIVAGPPPGISATGILFGPTLLRELKSASSILEACRHGAADVAGAGYTRPETVAAFVKYTSQPAEVITRSDRYDFARDLRIDQTTIEDMQREFFDEGALTYKEPLPPSRLVARF